MPVAHLLLALLVVFLWGFNFVVIKLGLSEMPPILFCAFRFTLAALPAVFFVRRPAVALRKVALYGLVMFGLQFSLVFGGMSLGLSPGIAALALQVHVFVTMVLAATLLKERLAAVSVVGALIAFGGIAVIALHSRGDVTATGLLLVLLGAVCWGVGSLLAKRLGPVNMFAVTVWASLAAPLPLFALSLAIEGPARIAASIHGLGWTSVGAVAYVVYLSTHIGFAAWGWLLSRHPASKVAPLTMLAPVVALASSALVFGEALQPWKLAAAGLVIGGLVLHLLGPRIRAVWSARAARQGAV